MVSRLHGFWLIWNLEITYLSLWGTGQSQVATRAGGISHILYRQEPNPILQSLLDQGMAQGAQPLQA
jgi:hypothetical protein